jgi:hypothetical protein
MHLGDNIYYSGTTTALPGSDDKEPATDKMPYTTLQYGNGPGYTITKTGRANITGVDTGMVYNPRQKSIH